MASPDVPARGTPCSIILGDSDNFWLHAAPIHPLYFYRPVRFEAQNLGTLPYVGGLVQNLHDLVGLEDPEPDHFDVIHLGLESEQLMRSKLRC